MSRVRDPLSSTRFRRRSGHHAWQTLQAVCDFTVTSRRGALAVYGEVGIKMLTKFESLHGKPHAAIFITGGSVSLRGEIAEQLAALLLWPGWAAPGARDAFGVMQPHSLYIEDHLPSGPPHLMAAPVEAVELRREVLAFASDGVVHFPVESTQADDLRQLHEVEDAFVLYVPWDSRGACSSALDHLIHENGRFLRGALQAKSQSDARHFDKQSIRQFGRSRSDDAFSMMFSNAWGAMMVPFFGPRGHRRGWRLSALTVFEEPASLSKSRIRLEFDDRGARDAFAQMLSHECGRELGFECDEVRINDLWCSLSKRGDRTFIICISTMPRILYCPQPRKVLADLLRWCVGLKTGMKLDFKVL